MSSFTTPLKLTPGQNPKGVWGWFTTRELIYIAKNGGTVTVPCGFFTDLGSIPSPFWPLFPPHDPRFAACFVLHDYLCRTAPRRFADDLFLEAMLAHPQLPRWRAYVMYAAVRIYARVS